MNRQPGKRRPFACQTTAIIFVLAGTPGVLLAQANDLLPARSEILSRPDQHMIDEINAIRRQLGGGIAEQLKELKLGDHVQGQLKGDFEEELNRLAAKRRTCRETAAAPVSNPTQLPGLGTALESGGLPAKKSAKESHWPVPTGLNRPDPGGPVAQSIQLKKLRSSARRLDEIAADLEEVGLFNEADSIRAQAGDFWLKARQIGNRP